jgi:hypothetical protein
MKKSLIFTMLLFMVIMAGGCSSTLKGAKKDTTDNAEWSKNKVNDGAKYIEKKTD